MSTKEMVKCFITNDEMEWEELGNGLRRKIMAYDQNLMMVKVQFEKGAVGTLHHHYHTQMTYIAEGVFEVEVSGEKKVLHAGDVFHVEPNLVHGAVSLEAGVLIDIFNPMREDFIKV